MGRDYILGLEIDDWRLMIADFKLKSLKDINHNGHHAHKGFWVGERIKAIYKMNKNMPLGTKVHGQEENCL